MGTSRLGGQQHGPCWSKRLCFGKPLSPRAGGRVEGGGWLGRHTAGTGDRGCGTSTSGRRARLRWAAGPFSGFPPGPPLRCPWGCLEAIHPSHPSLIRALPLGFSLKHLSPRCRPLGKPFGRSQMREGGRKTPCRSPVSPSPPRSPGQGPHSHTRPRTQAPAPRDANDNRGAITCEA